MRRLALSACAVFAAVFLSSGSVLAANRAPATTLSFTTFNVKWYGLNGRLEGAPGSETRAAAIRAHLQSNNLFTDVMAFQEVVDVNDLVRNVVGDGYSCESYAHSNSRHQHVVICVSSAYRFEVADDDDNFTLENVAMRDHRPAVHGVVKTRRGTPVAHVMAVHLKAMPDYSETRLTQTRMIAEYMADIDADLPIVIMGDFNVFNSDPEDMQAIFDEYELGMRELEVVEANTYRTPNLGSKLDRIWARGMSTAARPHAYGPCNAAASQRDKIAVFNRQVSDHCPVSFKLRAP